MMSLLRGKQHTKLLTANTRLSMSSCSTLAADTKVAFRASVTLSLSTDAHVLAGSPHPHLLLMEWSAAGKNLPLTQS